MSRIPTITGPEMVAALARRGFVVIRIKGSHHFLRDAEGRCTVVPVHAGETLGPGLLHKILRDCHLDVADIRRIP
jgi:predicted RNA binding protein YcfA (HicA-like mRNA interferase family)